MRNFGLKKIRNIAGWAIFALAVFAIRDFVVLVMPPRYAWLEVTNTTAHPIYFEVPYDDVGTIVLPKTTIILPKEVMRNLYEYIVKDTSGRVIFTHQVQKGELSKIYDGSRIRLQY
jgi:hypothetical protein